MVSGIITSWHSKAIVKCPLGGSEAVRIYQPTSLVIAVLRSKHISTLA